MEVCKYCGEDIELLDTEEWIHSNQLFTCGPVFGPPYTEAAPFTKHEKFKQIIEELYD